MAPPHLEGSLIHLAYSVGDLPRNASLYVAVSASTVLAMTDLHSEQLCHQACLGRAE